MKLRKVKNKAEYDVELDECKIKVGGKDKETDEKFVPNINMNKWNNECYLNVNYPFVITDEVETFDSEEIEIELENEKHKYYVKDGKLEYEIELESKPISNEIKLDLKFSDGLNFWLQRELTQEEIEQGCGRPENVVDSYAVHWKKKNNKYKTGKFCHIYRIKAIDKDGNWTWCKQDITGKIWTIEIPQEFLDDAVYPIVIDPVLGYDIPGASSFGSGTFKIGSHDVTDNYGGNITMFHVAVFQVHETNKEIKLAVYNCDQSDPNKGNPAGCTLIEQVLIPEAVVSDNNNIAAPEGNLVTANTRYWLGYIPEDNAIKIKYDDAEPKDAWYVWGCTYSLEFVSPFQTPINGNNNRRQSVWVDYEAPPVADPIFDPAEGEYIKSVDVTITCETESATIKYTTDGSDPAPDHGIEYIEPVHITVTLILKAIAYRDGLSDSNIITGVYTIISDIIGKNIISIDTVGKSKLVSAKDVKPKMIGVILKDKLIPGIVEAKGIKDE